MKCNIIQHNYTSYIRLFSVWYRGIFLRVTLYFGEPVGLVKMQQTNKNIP